jgi:hypothetical protein
MVGDTDVDVVVLVVKRERERERAERARNVCQVEYSHEACSLVMVPQSERDTDSGYFRFSVFAALIFRWQSKLSSEIKSIPACKQILLVLVQPSKDGGCSIGVSPGSGSGQHRGFRFD